MTLFGFGKTTKAIAKRFPQARFYDDNIHKPHTSPDGFHLNPSNSFDPLRSQVEIPSPGIPPNHPLIKQARNLVSEYDYFAKDMPYTVWISGTNGKTTTTQMIGHQLSVKSALLGGNIGTPLAELDPSADMWILETSSYTLHYTKVASPGLYILLPITPDHVAWHGSIEAYEEAKLQPLKTMQEGEIAIIPKKYANYPTNASLVTYETADDLAEYFNFDTSKINFKGAFLMDALLAMAVDKILFDRVNYEQMNSFTLDPHRQEKFVDKNERLWINDSKATNIDATVELLKTYSENDRLHLILGGDDKGVDLDDLFEHLKKYQTLTLYLIGKNSSRLAEYAQKLSIPHIECETLSKAVQKINKHHDKSSIAMLSPAAASLDQFSSYIDRGKQFKENIEELS
jgi:UDP-N-acetylmuramoylalanine--D-glutamate ligase